MKHQKVMPNVVDFAYQIVDMDHEISMLRAKVATLKEYQQRYFDLLNEGTAHSQKMIAGILDIALVPGVMQAISEHNKDTQP